MLDGRFETLRDTPSVKHTRPTPVRYSGEFAITRVSAEMKLIETSGSTRRRAFSQENRRARLQRSVITRRRAGSVSTSVTHVECRSRSARIINSAVVRRRHDGPRTIKYPRCECSPPPRGHTQSLRSHANYRRAPVSPPVNYRRYSAVVLAITPGPRPLTSSGPLWAQDGGGGGGVLLSALAEADRLGSSWRGAARGGN